jgi:hypothetical protein
MAPTDPPLLTEPVHFRKWIRLEIQILRLGRPDLGLVILGDDLLLRRTDQIAFGVRRGTEAQKEQKAAKAPPYHFVHV